MNDDLEAELLKALMVTYATALIVAASVQDMAVSDQVLRDRIHAVKGALSWA